MYKNLDAKAFQQALENTPDAQIIDVRTPMEFAEGHIPGAVNINLMDPRFAQQIKALDPEKTYFVYCRSGNRSGTACGFMHANGFREAINMADGLFRWKGTLATNA